MAETEWVGSLDAEVRNSSTVTFSWSRSGTWEHPKQWVACRNSAGGEWDQREISPNADSFTWYDCNPGQHYDFRVWVNDYDDNGNLTYESGWYYLYGVPVDAALPTGFGVASMDVPSGSVEVAWEQNPYAELGRAELWYRDELARDQGAWFDDVPTTNSDSYTFEGLPGGRAYDFWIRQRYADSGYTDRVIGDVWLPGLSDLRWEYAEDRTQVKLSWEVNGYLAGISGEGLAESSPKSGAWATVYWEDRAMPGTWETVDSWIPATTTEYTVGGLEPGRAYRFCVRVRDFGYPIWHEGMRDNDLYTPYVSMPALAKPKAASNLRAEYSKSSGSILVTWRNNESFADACNQPYDQVRVYRSADGGAWEEVSAGSVEESFEDAVERGHFYRYKVVPSNGAGDGPEAVSPTVDVAEELPPKAVSSLKAAYDAQTRRVTVTWSTPSTWERPADELRVYRSRDGGDYGEELGTCEGSPYIDQAPEGGHSYRYLVQARNAAGWGASAESNVVVVPPQLPDAPKSLEASCDGDTASLTWESSADDGKPYILVAVERSSNGGAFSQVGTVGGSSEFYGEPLPANGSFRYRVRAGNSAGWSPYSDVAGPVYTRPSAPAKPQAKRSPGGCGVMWRQTAFVCDGSQVEPSWFDPGLYEWVPMAVIDIPAGASALTDPSPQTDAAMSYRVRSGVRTADGTWLWSEWSERSEPVAPGQAPAAPRILAPRAGETVAFDPGASDVDAAWLHNPLDGSDQTAFELRLAFGGSVRGSLSGGADMACPGVLGACGVDLLAMASEMGTVVYTEDWELSVRTRGTDPEWSPWSASRFRVARRPAVFFERPGGDGVMSEFPPVVALGFEGYGYGPAGQDAVLITAIDSDGNVAGSATFPFAEGTFEAELGPSFWSPEAQGRYTVRAVVHASSGLDGSAEASVSTDFPSPKHSSLRVECDPERGWVTLVPSVNANDTAGRPVQSMDVWRVVDGRSVLVAGGVAEGQEVTDRFAPVNRPFVYRLGAYSDQGVYSVSDHPGSLRSMYAFLYYGEGFSQVARGTFSLQDSAALTRSRQTLVEYAGRAYPVLYDGGGMAEARSAQFTVEGEGEWRPFREAASCGEVCYKGVDGEVFRASAEITVEIPEDLPSSYRSVSLELTRVDGDAL